MRLRLVAPQFFATLLAGFIVTGYSTGAWVTALVTAVISALLVALAAHVAARPLVERIGSLASNMRNAAALSPSHTYVAGEDDLEMACRTFLELSAEWNHQLAEMSIERKTATAVLDGMAEGIWVTDSGGTIVQRNRALGELLPSSREILGKTPLSLIRSNDLNRAVTRACQNGESSRLEVTVEGPRPRLLAVQVMPVGFGLPGSAAVFHDLTELRRLEQVRKDFVANISHELRTPITAIRGYAETLLEGAMSDPKHAPRMLEIIHRQSERLSLLVNDLLELSRLEAGDLKMQQEPLPLDESVARALDAVRPKAHQKNIPLELQLPDELVVRADPKALEQVLINLLDNAVKYTPANGRVLVTGGTEGARCFLTVADTGIGIEQRHLSRVFERFYRVDPGRSRDTGGTGLGLSIVKHLMGAMGGEVKVSSRAGEGSEFTIFLPASAAAIAANG